MTVPKSKFPAPTPPGVFASAALPRSLLRQQYKATCTASSTKLAPVHSGYAVRRSSVAYGARGTGSTVYFYCNVKSSVTVIFYVCSAPLCFWRIQPFLFV